MEWEVAKASQKTAQTLEQSTGPVDITVGEDII